MRVSILRNQTIKFNIISQSVIMKALFSIVRHTLNSLISVGGP